MPHKEIGEIRESGQSRPSPCSPDRGALRRDARGTLLALCDLPVPCRPREASRWHHRNSHSGSFSEQINGDQGVECDSFILLPDLVISLL